AAWNDGFIIGTKGQAFLAYGSTFDGGQTWRGARVQVGDLQILSDPSVAVDSQGNFYLGFLGFSPNGSNADRGVLVEKSTDGGATFGDPVKVNTRGDKPYIAVDQRTDALYMVYEDIFKSLHSLAII